MNNNKSILQKKLEHFEDACREVGLKITHQRWEVFRELASANDHPTAEILFKRLQENIPTLSLDTVYRTLSTFEEHDLISRVQTTESHARFEAEMDQHHHAICTECGIITDFQCSALGEIQLPSQIASWGRIDKQQITLYGVCEKCSYA